MASFGFVEDSIRQYIVEMINEIIREENLPFERADAQVEIKDTSGKRRKFPDIVIWDKGQVLVKGALLIALKQPMYMPLLEEIVEDAFLKASWAGIPYFATCNMQNLVLFDSYEKASLMDRRKGIYHISSIGHPNEITREDVRKEMKFGLKKFLLQFAEIYSGIKPLPTVPVDEFFIYNLRGLVDSLSRLMTEELIKKFERDSNFKSNFQKWFVEQGWLPPLNTTSYYDEFNRAARQYLYLLAIKLMFYQVLRLHCPTLDALEIPEKINKGDDLAVLLQEYFQKAKEESGDYETIFGMDFIEKFPLPDAATDGLKRFIVNLLKYDFKRIGYADLGKIFDKLIPDNERHKLGQYFTSQKHKDGTYWTDVVDLILGFTVKSPEVTILDGAVGAGTFLVRGYARLKYLNPFLKHQEIISKLFGVDVSKFPALLSAINLAIRDLSVKENYPIIINRDFFDIEPSGDPQTMKKWVDVKQRLLMLTTKKEQKISLPVVQVFIGNPPYTRQEEIEDYIPEYKRALEERIKADWGLKLGKRCSIYVYFMLHGLKFLTEGGRLGYVTSSSWLDVDYGKYLQKFLLENTKIIAIIESKAERWFEDADINTAITIVEKCSDERLRNKNLVKFVQLKKRLEEIIPTANENERWKAIDDLVKKIEKTDKYYEDDVLRIYPKQQSELLREGTVEKKRNGKKEVSFVCSKWGKYIRAPEIFFKILEKGKDLFVPLRKIAEIRRGFTTGANEFFYLKDEKARYWGIEEKFLKPVIVSLRESKTIEIDPNRLKYKILMVHENRSKLEGTNVLKYIEYGEEQGYHRRPTCASRKRWYDLGKRSPGVILYPERMGDRFVILLNQARVYVNKNLYEIYPKKGINPNVLCAILNSTMTALFNELHGRVLIGAQNVIDIDVWMVGIIPVIDPRKIPKEKLKILEEKFKTLSKRPIEHILKEIGAEKPEDVSLGKVKQDRRELDQIIFEIIGLTKSEQQEIYRAIVDLVKSRIEKGGAKRKKKVKGLDIDKLAVDVIREIKISPLPNFPDDYLTGTDIERNIKLPSGRKIKIETELEGIWLNIDEQRIPCSTPEEARYLFWAALTGKRDAPIPRDESKITHITNVFMKEYNERVKKIQEWLEKNVPNKKDRQKILHKIIERLLRTTS